MTNARRFGVVNKTSNVSFVGDRQLRDAPV
jgi:hypothetical protein